jgi:RNA polymerase sigma-70 factor (ECF subfamily)
LAPARDRSDEWLAAHVGRIRPEPFELLFQRHWAGIERYCRAQLRCPELAADVAQDTMMSAYAHLRQRSAELGSFRAWLYTVARNICIDRVRGFTTKPRAVELPGDNDYGAVADLANPLEVKDRLRTLIADLQALSERQRTALLMREASGLGHVAIARRLGTTPPRAKALVFEARKTLEERRAGRGLSCEEFASEAARLGHRRPGTHKLGAHLAGCATCSAAYEPPPLVAA